MVHALVGDEQAVMLNVKGGMYYGLNAVGARMWELLESPRTVGQLCAQLCEEFEVEAETCRLEILEFAGKLLAEGIVHADPA